ncbi:hypothetical protein CHS0354_001701, partial [Potamilus streckersoni]
MKIAVVGCGHGELDHMYKTVEDLEKLNKYKVDLVLICGDFQALRNKSDMQCMAVPQKYQKQLKMKSFYKYYSGEKKAPVLTVFIGGNHEASNYMQELPYGGWVAPNIYYMGYAGIINVGGIRIGGISGIYNESNYARGHFEHPPYTDETIKSVYNIRNLDIFRLKQVTRDVQIMMSHDWPRGIYNYGNVRKLLRRKWYFSKEIETNTLGSPPAMELLLKLKPQYWFSAHLHAKFEAVLQHDESGKQTRFLALDKCEPGKKGKCFLELIDVPHDVSKPIELMLDPEWLAILKSTNHLLNLTKTPRYVPGPGGYQRYDFRVSDQEIDGIYKDFGGDQLLPEQFEITVPGYHPSDSTEKAAPPAQMMINEQTTVNDSLSSPGNDRIVSAGNHEVSLGDDDDDVGDDMVSKMAAEGNDKIDVTEYDEDDELQAILSAQNDLRMKLESAKSADFKSSGDIDMMHKGCIKNAHKKLNFLKIISSFRASETKVIFEKESGTQSSSLSNTSMEKKFLEISVKEDEDRLLEILKVQREDLILRLTKYKEVSMFGDTGEDLNDNSGLVGDQSASDFQKELEHLKPVHQSSPAVSIGECIDVSKNLGAATRLAASVEKTGFERGDNSVNATPEVKKLKKRNEIGNDSLSSTANDSIVSAGDDDEVSLRDDDDVDDDMGSKMAAEGNDKIDVTEYDVDDEVQAILSAQNDMRMKLES